MSDYYGNRDDREARLQRRRKRRRRRMIAKAVVLLLLCAILVVCVLFLTGVIGGNRKQETQTSSEAPADTGSADSTGSTDSTDSSAGGEASSKDSTASGTESTASADAKIALSEAGDLAATYDYDGAIALLQAVPGYESDASLTAAIAEYTAQKEACVAYDTEQVPHFFFHSLMNDTRGLDTSLFSESVVAGNNTWMCTADEFRTILQQMYDYGCVLVTMRDLVNETVDADGTVHFTKNENLMLPEGKTPVIMSEDDLSYYHSYDGQGYATKLVIDENGDVKCEYTNPDGETLIGDYDVVPILNAFIEEHPDFSYKGARCMIALTGYNGVFGYRTDIVYKTRDEATLDDDQRVWLDAHPDFNYEEEVAEATKIAEALKAEGYEFASHTWGHRNVGNIDAAGLQTDNEKWINTVENIVGDVDTIIFAHGTDIAGIEDYTEDNALYAYLKSAGYHYFANVDGSAPYWIQIRDDYVRTARIDIDGYRLYQAMVGSSTSVADLTQLGIHDIDSFFEPARPTPIEL